MFLEFFSGALIPLYLFPNNILSVVQYLPFPSLVYGPTNALSLTSVSGTNLNILISGFIWGVLLSAGMFYYFYHNLKKYEAIGI